MADSGIEGFLTRKWGPLPVWAYAAGGGALAGVVFLYKKGSGSATGGTDQVASGAPGTGPYAPSPIVITNPGMGMPQGTSSLNPTSTVSGYKAGSSGTTVWNGHPYKWVVTGPGTGPSEAAKAFGSGDANSIARVVYFTPTPQADTQGNTLWFMGLTDGGQTLPAWGTAPWPPPYMGSQPPGSGSGGMGGGHGSSVKTLAGAGRMRRFVGAHAHPQWVVTSGMGGGGASTPMVKPKGMASLANRTRIPLIRLHALNPHLRLPSGEYADGVTRLG